MGERGGCFQEFSPSVFLIPPQQRAVTTHLPEKFIRDSGPRVSTGGWLDRHPLPSTCQNPRVPEGEQVLCINHVVHTNNASTARHSYQLGWWEPSQNPSAQTPAKGQHSSLPKHSSLRPAINFSLHHHTSRGYQNLGLKPRSSDSMWHHLPFFSLNIMKGIYSIKKERSRDTISIFNYDKEQIRAH